jgi:hypothetical protein
MRCDDPTEHSRTLAAAEPEYRQLYLEEVEAQLRCSNSFCRGAPLTQLFLLAGQEMAAGQGRLLADVVVDNVQQGGQSDYVRNFIRSAPHCWEELKNPSPELLRRFESSVDNDPNVNNAKDFNRFFIHAVPSMAGIVSKALEDGILRAEYKGVTYEAKIDLSGLPQAFKEALPLIDKQTPSLRRSINERPLQRPGVCSNTISLRTDCKSYPMIF